jgi:hypothetical protein
MGKYALAILGTVYFVAPAVAAWGYCSAEGVERKVLYVSAVFSSNYFSRPGMETAYRRFLESEGVNAGPTLCAADQNQFTAIAIRNQATDAAMKKGHSVQPFGPF